MIYLQIVIEAIEKKSIGQEEEEGNFLAGAGSVPYVVGK